MNFLTNKNGNAYFSRAIWIGPWRKIILLLHVTTFPLHAVAMMRLASKKQGNGNLSSVDDEHEKQRSRKARLLPSCTRCIRPTKFSCRDFAQSLIEKCVNPHWIYPTEVYICDVFPCLICLQNLPLSFSCPLYLAAKFASVTTLTHYYAV